MIWFRSKFLSDIEIVLIPAQGLVDTDYQSLNSVSHRVDLIWIVCVRLHNVV